MGLFGKRWKRSIDDPDLGRITEDKAASWEGHELTLWGRTSIQVMLDAGPDGPSAEQRSFVRSLRSNEELRARIEQAVAKHASESATSTEALHLSSIYLPQSPLCQVWKVWFDIEGKDHYWYGAESEGLNRIVPFAED